MMKIDAPVPPDRIREALLDFSPSRTDRWPGVSPAVYEVYRIGVTDADIREGGPSPFGPVWTKLRYDWADPETVRWTVLDSNCFRPGSFSGARIRPTPTGSRIILVWKGAPKSLTGVILTTLTVLTRGAPIIASMRAGLKRLAENEAA